MKTLFLTSLLLIILLSVLVADGSYEVIYIYTDKDELATFREAGRWLMNAGYELQTTEPIFLMITTKVTERRYGFLGGGRIAVKFYIEINETESGSLIKLTGKYLSDAAAMEKYIGLELDFDADGDVIVKRGARGSPARAAWELMDELAKSFPNGKIIYELN